LDAASTMPSLKLEQSGCRERVHAQPRCPYSNVGRSDRG
jgi:hypothetical protein